MFDCYDCNQFAATFWVFLPPYFISFALEIACQLDLKHTIASHFGYSVSVETISIKPDQATCTMNACHRVPIPSHEYVGRKMLKTYKNNNKT